MRNEALPIGRKAGNLEPSGDRDIIPNPADVAAIGDDDVVRPVGLDSLPEESDFKIGCAPTHPASIVGRQSRCRRVTEIALVIPVSREVVDCVGLEKTQANQGDCENS